MKKNLLTTIALVGLVMSLGCSKDEPNEPTVILADGITITTPKNNRIGIGQIVIASTNIKSSKDGISYLWKDEHSFTSTKDTLRWFPTKVGEQTIFLTLRQNGTSKTLTKKVNVEECDFRLCFWGQDMAEVIGNELVYTAYYHKKVNKPIMSGAPQFIAFQDIEDSNLMYAYYFDRQLNVLAGIDIYSIQHNVNASDLEGYNEYLKDYEKQKIHLTSKYGKPVTDEINYKFDFTDKSPKYLGYNVVFGSCTLKTTYVTKSSKITLQMKNGEKYGTATIDVFYEKKV